MTPEEWSEKGVAGSVKHSSEHHSSFERSYWCPTGRPIARIVRKNEKWAFCYAKQNLYYVVEKRDDATDNRKRTHVLSKHDAVRVDWKRAERPTAPDDLRRRRHGSPMLAKYLHVARIDASHLPAYM